jgi:hypothetical protein
MKSYKKQRREEALLRQAEYDKLTPKQKLSKLDAKFGVGNGAQRQRSKLTAIVEKGKVGHE